MTWGWVINDWIFWKKKKYYVFGRTWGGIYGWTISLRQPYSFPSQQSSSQVNKRFSLCLDSLFNSLWWHKHDEYVLLKAVVVVVLLLSASTDSRIRDFYPCSHNQKLPLGTKLRAFQESQEECMPSGKPIKLRIHNSMYLITLHNTCVLIRLLLFYVIR